MKRRSFIKKAGVILAGTAAAPNILPSGRLFARTGTAMVDHVVFVLFAGGVRQQESVMQLYLDDSQGEPIQGNILYNLLEGAPPSSKIAYGTNGVLDGDTPIPKILGQTLQKQGVLFKELEARRVGHYAGLNAMITGSYAATQGLKQKPLSPTLFEYIRRHMNVPATKVWFVGNGISNSIPLLNHSNYPGYGVEYGGNFIAPNITFGAQGQNWMSNAKVYHPEEELDPMYKMKFFLDNVANKDPFEIPGIKNTDAEKHDLKQFFDLMFDKVSNGTVAHPPVQNADTRTLGFAAEVMSYFKPKLTVVNLNNIDSCHGNFTNYLQAMHRADHGVGHLWNYIQTQIPEMAGNTAIILAPEHGRNSNRNLIKDNNNWRGYDHSDQNSRRVFGMMAGPGIPQNLAIGDPFSGNAPTADISNACLTVGEMLGIRPEMEAAGILDPITWFDRI